MRDALNVARAYDLVMVPADALLVWNWRARLWRRVEGPRVLDAGIGTGLNIEHYRTGLSVTGIDRGKWVLERARRRAHKAAVDVTLVQGDVGEMPFADGSFDAVVTTFVFCSVVDPDRALGELWRVLRPGGRFFALEHVRSRGMLGQVMSAVSLPLYRRFGDHIARDTVGSVGRSGFCDVTVEPVLLDVVKLIHGRRE